MSFRSLPLLGLMFTAAAPAAWRFVIPALGALLRAPGALAAQTGISISDASTSEAGTSGTNQIVFRVRVARDTTTAAGQVSVQYQGASGTATVVTTQCGPGVDIVLQPSTLIIGANASQGDIHATVCEDALDEADAETFTVTLLSAVGSSIQRGQATGTLLDDEPTPSLRVADVAAAEGAVGEQRILNFTISLSAPSGRPVSVSYAVAGGSGSLPAAQAGAGCGGAIDFVTRSGSESFPVGTTSRQVAITLCGDGLFEQDERLTMTLSAPSNATIADGTGVGSISNDDAQPVATVILPNGGDITEGSGGPHVVSMRVTLSSPNHGGASVTFTRAGTAVRGTACTGATDVVVNDQVSVSWPANNNAERTVDLTICGDAADDDNDTIELNVTGGAGVAMAPGSQTNQMVILDDDPTPALSVVDASVTEGGQAQVNVTLSVASNRDVDVLVGSAEMTAAVARLLPSRLNNVAPATSGGACTGAVDFLKTSHRLQIPAGSLTAATPLRITTCKNTDMAGSRSLTVSTVPEVFQVSASGPTNATIGRAAGIVVIQEP